MAEITGTHLLDCEHCRRYFHNGGRRWECLDHGTVTFKLFARTLAARRIQEARPFHVDMRGLVMLEYVDMIRPWYSGKVPRRRTLHELDRDPC